MNKSYEFKEAGGINNLYAFKTENEITYEIRFKPTDYIFEGRLDFYVPTFELSITVAKNNLGRNPPLDLKIPHTIASIFKHFYQKNEKQVVIYICMSADLRQAVRKRKFDSWAETLKSESFFKFDVEIIDTAGIVYYNSIILRANNPYRLQILNSFLELANEQTK